MSVTAAPSPASETAGADLTAIIRARFAEAGVQADDPIVPLLAGLAEMAEATRHSATLFSDGLTRLHEVAMAEKSAMKAATEQCRATTLKLEATFGTLQARADNLMTQAIASMADRVADKASERMVIVERRHNRIVLWRAGAAIAAVLLAMTVLGWVARARLDRPATAMLAACSATVVQDKASGEFYCLFGRAPPP